MIEWYVYKGSDHIAAFNDLTGSVFGKLTVIRRVDDYVSPNGYKKSKWRCQCECGNIVDVLGNSLQKGETTSCGCYAHDEKVRRATTHGMSNTALHSIWKGMKARCYNTHHKNYKSYGGRGITVCDEWLGSFQRFADWANKNGYKDGLTIDRIDNDGNYAPDNCRWVTRVVQANNRRSNRVIPFNGESHNIGEWSQITGIPYHTLYMRIIHGWDIAKALTI